jgi:hypothetical protein
VKYPDDLVSRPSNSELSRSSAPLFGTLNFIQAAKNYSSLNASMSEASSIFYSCSPTILYNSSKSPAYRKTSKLSTPNTSKILDLISCGLALFGLSEKKTNPDTKRPETNDSEISLSFSGWY